MKRLFLSCCGMLAVVGLACAQDTSPQRQLLAVDFDAAQAKYERDLKERPDSIDHYRSVIPEGVDSVQFPVLLPRIEDTRSTPAFSSQGTAYAGVFALDRAQMTVAGSVEALPGEVPSDDGSTFIELEDGALLTFVQFNVPYQLLLTCALPETDERCTSSSFLERTREGLVVVGVNKQ
jgi:hypothetical protein